LCIECVLFEVSAEAQETVQHWADNTAGKS